MQNTNNGVVVLQTPEEILSSNHYQLPTLLSLHLQFILTGQTPVAKSQTYWAFLLLRFREIITLKRLISLTLAQAIHQSCFH